MTACVLQGLSATCLPPATQSRLPHCIGLLFASGAMADMSFEIRPPQADQEQLDWMDVNVFPAHRCIVAARCSWLRRALQSGMIEDISRSVRSGIQITRVLGLIN